MQFDIITLFPNSYSYLNESIVKRAKEKNLVKINIHNLRDWSTDKHHTVDDKPFGGNPGMLIKLEVVYNALKALGVYPNKDPKTKVILTSAKGKQWNQTFAQTYSKEIDRVVILCGHYEGFDHRIVENLIDEEISIGNYVLSGGELPSMVILDSIIRLMPGVLGSEESLQDETTEGNPEYPQYTRPSTFKNDEGEEWTVPEVLLSGNHAEIEEWKANKKG
ncbi:MAG: tRNA (guanosine(37)-N1)-methyltransferase TrmD [Candidatus Dojkabacteria bacterium]